MDAETITITELDAETLSQAYDNSYFTITGAGGSLQDWINGYSELLERRGVSAPIAWFTCKGADVNLYFRELGLVAQPHDLFQEDVTLLMFNPSDTDNVMGLSLFRMEMRDRWFDDIVDNVRRRAL